MIGTVITSVTMKLLNLIMLLKMKTYVCVIKTERVMN